MYINIAYFWDLISVTTLVFIVPLEGSRRRSPASVEVFILFSSLYNDHIYICIVLIIVYIIWFYSYIYYCTLYKSQSKLNFIRSLIYIYIYIYICFLDLFGAKFFLPFLKSLELIMANRLGYVFKRHQDIIHCHDQTIFLHLLYLCIDEATFLSHHL